MHTVSDWGKNKLSYSLAKETIKKKASFTSLPQYFDDVKSDKFLSTITEGYDEGENYETSEVLACYLCHYNFSKKHAVNMHMVYTNQFTQT